MNEGTSTRRIHTQTNRHAEKKREKKKNKKKINSKCAKACTHSIVEQQADRFGCLLANLGRRLAEEVGERCMNRKSYTNEQAAKPTFG